MRTAFEVLGASLGAPDALFGGGRYDGLVEELGGPAVPGFGFACGLDRLVLSLPEPSGPSREVPDVFVAALGGAAWGGGPLLVRAPPRGGLLGGGGAGPREGL